MPEFNPSNEADLLLAANEDVRHALDSMTAERWQAASSGDEWSAAEIVGHMIEFEPYWARVAAAVAAQPGSLAGRPLDDSRRVGGPQSGVNLSPAEAANRLTVAGNEAADIIRVISAQDGEKIGKRWDGSAITVDQIVRQLLVGHLREHTEQLRSALGSS